jgi:hypothetical protein
VEGGADFSFTEGKFGRLELLSFVAKATGIGAFDQMFFHSFQGGLDVKDGAARLRDVRATGQAVELAAQGTVGLDGALDVRVNPRVGPRLRGLIKNEWAQKVLLVADGVTALPIDVTVQGTVSRPRYGVAPRMYEPVKTVGGVVTQTLTGATKKLGEAAPATGEGAGQIKDAVQDTLRQGAEGVRDALRGVLGGRKKEDKE